MNQTESTGTLIVNRKTESPNENSSKKKISYPEGVQLSPIELKPTSSQTLWTLSNG